MKVEATEKHTMEGYASIGFVFVGIVGVILRIIRLVLRITIVYPGIKAGTIKLSRSDPFSIFIGSADFATLLFYFSFLFPLIAIGFGYIAKKKNDDFGYKAILIGIILILFSIALGFVD